MPGTSPQENTFQTQRYPHAHIFVWKGIKLYGGRAWIMASLSVDESLLVTLYL
jgi:hypothetical protein